jgi:hypothetical protein
MSFEESQEHPIRIPRRSSCASESRRYQLEQWAESTVEKRIHAALTMSNRFSWLKPSSEIEESGKQ